MYISLADTLMKSVTEKWDRERETMQNYDGKVLYYLSADWLMGRTLGNMLLNMTEQKEVGALLRDRQIDLNLIEEQEQDITLGFGGLGRVAACMMDSFTTMGYPAYGCGIRYVYGLYRQKIRGDSHQEMPDDWLKDGNPFEVCREEEAVEVNIGKLQILAIPYDMPIVGYGCKQINTLRLWEARPKHPLDYDMLDKCGEKNFWKYRDKIENEVKIKFINNCLLPREYSFEGERLCFQQKYFFVAASVRWAVKQHMEKYHDIHLFHQKNMLLINDDASVFAVAELMQILLEEYHLPWEVAWNITARSCSYTRHTLLPKAFKAWPVRILEEEVPGIYQIIKKIDDKLALEVRRDMPQAVSNLEDMSLIYHEELRAGNLAAYVCSSVNGVSKQHSEDLKHNDLAGFYRLCPEKFHNKSNGVTHRRFLMHANPLLAEWITEKIGDGWITDSIQLERLKEFAGNQICQKEFMEIRYQNKVRLAEYIHMHEEIQIDPSSIYVAQVKVMYPHKRHLMNLLYVMKRYCQLKDNPRNELLPVTFIFSGKPMINDDYGKKVICLIQRVAHIINNDSSIHGKIKLVYLENYCVSVNERVVAAADISEQISIVGKEASGTSALKFMLNGALTVGTRYGTNQEIAQKVGQDRMFLFGEENICADKNNSWDDIFAVFRSDEQITAILEQLLCSPKTVLYGLYDLPEFAETQALAEEKYQDKNWWAETAIWNVACAGSFTSDCTVKAYTE